jgi:hypothetical protein
MARGQNRPGRLVHEHGLSGAEELHGNPERDPSYEEAVRDRHRVLVELSETFATLLRLELAAGETSR